MSPPRTGEEVGTVAGLWRYPVKGMRGEGLEQLRFGWHGPDGDRAFTLVRVADRSGLPFLSPRRCPQLTSYVARLDERQVVVTTPSGSDVEIWEPALVDELESVAGERLAVMQLWRHAVDSMAVSLITTSSVASAATLAGGILAVERFRPNILVRTKDDPRDFPEDRWVGTTLMAEQQHTMLRMDRATQRCTVVDIDPDTGAIDSRVFTAVRDHRRNKLGVYGTVARPGTMTLAEPLVVHG